MGITLTADAFTCLTYSKGGGLSQIRSDKCLICNVCTFCLSKLGSLIVVSFQHAMRVNESEWE